VRDTMPMLSEWFLLTHSKGGIFQQGPEKWSRAWDCARAGDLSMRLILAHNDQPSRKGMSDESFELAVMNQPVLLPSVCSQCYINQYAHHLTPYHEFQNPDTIRLLELFPGSMDDTLVGHLRCYTLDDARDHYEALSYSWRLSTFTTGNLNCQITSNDVSLDIEANLWFALRRIRLTDRPRVLWIDGIWEVDNSFPASRRVG